MDVPEEGGQWLSNVKYSSPKVLSDFSSIVWKERKYIKKNNAFNLSACTEIMFMCENTYMLSLSWKIDASLDQSDGH